MLCGGLFHGFAGGFEAPVGWQRDSCGGGVGPWGAAEVVGSFCSCAQGVGGEEGGDSCQGGDVLSLEASLPCRGCYLSDGVVWA